MPIVFNDNNPLLPSEDDFVIGPPSFGPSRTEAGETDPFAHAEIWHHEKHRVFKVNGVFKIGDAVGSSMLAGSKFDPIPFKVSFDFDSTLAIKKVQLLLSVMDRSKVEVFIVTSRNETDHCVPNKDMLAVASAFSIPSRNIFCTNGMPKAAVLERIGADIHFDDMPDEIAMINAKCTNTLGVLVTKDIWNDVKFLQNTFSEPTPSIQKDMEEFE